MNLTPDQFKPVAKEVNGCKGCYFDAHPTCPQSCLSEQGDKLSRAVEELHGVNCLAHCVKFVLTTQNQ